MSEYLRLLLILGVAVNPAAAWLAFAATREKLGRRARRLAALVGLAVAGVLYAVAVLVAEDLLDWLEIAPETFRIAAGIVMATSGVLVLLRGRPGVRDLLPGERATWQAGIAPLGLPLLAGPAALIAAMSYGMDEGQGKAWLAAMPWVAIAAGLSLARAGRWAAGADAVARIGGAVLVVVSAGLIVEGVRDI